MPKNKKKCFSYELNLVKVFKDTLYSTFGLKENVINHYIYSWHYIRITRSFPLSPKSTLLFFIYYDHRCLYSNQQPQLSVSGKYLNNIFL